MAKKPINVFITEGNHKTQPFTVRIEQGKTDTILSQRYTQPYGGKLASLRKLKAKTSLGNTPNNVTRPLSRVWFVGDRTVVFTVKRKSSKKGKA